MNTHYAWIALAAILVIIAAYLLMASFCKVTGSAIANPLLLDLEANKAFCKYDKCPGFCVAIPIASHGYHKECARSHCEEHNPKLYLAILKREREKRISGAYEFVRGYHRFHQMIKRRQSRSEISGQDIRLIKLKLKLKRLRSKSRIKGFNE